jgi:hypothetical protein
MAFGIWREMYGNGQAAGMTRKRIVLYCVAALSYSVPHMLTVMTAATMALNTSSTPTSGFESLFPRLPKCILDAALLPQKLFASDSLILERGLGGISISQV